MQWAIGAISVAAAFAFLTMPAHAQKCTNYERQVAEAATAVAKFRQSPRFVEYGWSAAGPFSKWLQAIQALQADRDNALALLGRYGFAPMAIYSVADEYRTAGSLDSFYKDLDRSIKGLKCERQ
jgi:hypothetical protein